MHSIVVSLLAYTLAATVLTVTPGLDTALMVRTATNEGPRPALWCGLGIVTGCLIWTELIAAGSGVLCARRGLHRVARRQPRRAGPHLVHPVDLCYSPARDRIYNGFERAMTTVVQALSDLASTRP